MLGPEARQTDQDGLYCEPFLALDPGVHTSAIWGLDADNDGRFLVTGSDDKTVRVWSAEDGRLLLAIRVPRGPGDLGKIFAVAISPDGGTVAAGGCTGNAPGNFNIYLFDRAAGREIGRITALPSRITHLAFSPDGTKLAVLCGKNGIRLFDSRTLGEIAADTDYADESWGLAFDRSGRIGSTSYDGKIRLYGPALDRLMTVEAPDGKRPDQIAFSPDGTRIAIGYRRIAAVTVLDGRTLRKLFTRNVDHGNLCTVAWSADGEILFAGGSYGLCPEIDAADHCRAIVRAWPDGGRGAAQDHPLTSTDGISGLQPLGDGRLAAATTDPRVVMLNNSGSIAWQAEPRTADFRGQLKALLVSSDGTRIGFEHRGYEGTFAVPARFDLRGRQLEFDASPDSGLSAARTDGPAVEDWEDTDQPKLARKMLALEPKETSRSLATAPGANSFILGSEWGLSRFGRDGELDWRIQAPAVAWAVNVTQDGRIAVAAFGDGTIRWYRMEDSAALLAFFPHSDRKRWVAWTPLGHYAASPGGEDLIRWQINCGLDKEPAVYTASRFRDQFCRPDVVERVLDELDPLKALEAADREAGRHTIVKSVAEDTPPRVAIIDPADSTFIEKPDLAVAYTVEDRPGSAIRRVRLLLDGHVAAEAKSLTIPPSGRLTGELRVTLQGELPVLTLLAESDKGSSDPSSIRVRRRADEDAYKPVLYGVAIGVSQFENHPELTLNFAAADAEDFVSRLRQQEGGLYRRVELRLLRNKDATEKAISEALEWIEREMTARDVAVVFFSTHGANDGKGNFYLLPYDVNDRDELALRHTAVKYADIRETLSTLADRGKTLVFLDACHSGNVVPGAKAQPADIDKVASDLAAAENGVIVFSSSTGNQFSIEMPEFGHGAFTAALLEAFDGKSNRPPPWLYVSDLDIWLAERVKKLTNGTQTPRTTVHHERFTNPKVFMMQTGVGVHQP
jgi:hypothetical protein